MCLYQHLLSTVASFYKTKVSQIPCLDKRIPPPSSQSRQSQCLPTWKDMEIMENPQTPISSPRHPCWVPDVRLQQDADFRPSIP